MYANLNYIKFLYFLSSSHGNLIFPKKNFLSNIYLTIGDISPIIKGNNFAKFKIDFYHKVDNSCPVTEFLDSLAKRYRKEYLERMDKHYE